jgi:ABC-type multidrug transport system ATPase subunit
MMVICSLHQPSFEILDLIDNVIVLDSGQTIYNVRSRLKPGSSEPDREQDHPNQRLQLP